MARQADVRDLGSLQSVVADAVSEFGGVDILSANAGIASFGPCWELIVLTSSAAYANLGHYTAAKHGVVGLMRNLAGTGLHRGNGLGSVCPAA
nr:SDR family NAD(P)-dependent oxidoreductase [Amycolatopsis thermoflava]